MCALNICGLTQIINDPTRVTNVTSSLLDHILVSNSDNIVDQGTIDVGFSDHKMIYCIRKITRKPVLGDNMVYVRSMKNYTKDVLVSHIEQATWDPVLKCNDTDVAWTNFEVIMNTIIDSVAPSKQCKIKLRSEPWVTGEILENIAARDKYLCMFNKSKDTAYYAKYCKLRNTVQRLVKTAQNDYIADQIDQNKNDSKKMWSTLKTLGYNNKAQVKSPMVLEVDGEVCYDPVTLANHVNEFFVNVANRLVEKLPKLVDLYSAFSDKCKQFYLNIGLAPDMYRLKQVDRTFVLGELLAMKCTKSTGLDNIGPKFLKDGAEALVDIITYLVNMSIRNKVVPSCTKRAKVIPLYKKNNKLDVSNYRPVSVLTSISKVLEKAVHKQVEYFCKTHNVLYSLQSGFRASHSTDTCLLYLHDHIKSEISLGKFVGIVLLDVQKAFDSVDHEMLCEKIKLTGIDPEWFRSYLTSRKQSVLVNNCMSSELTIKCGVPQGSILGPWCYLIYSNDMSCSVSESCQLIMYADDTILLVSDKCLDNVSAQLSSAINNCYHWLTNNRLSMHKGKTEAIILSSKRKLHLTNNFVITCQGSEIKPTNEVKYLGLHLDQTLSGERTVNSVVSKCNSRLKFMYRYRRALSENSRKLLTSALIQCHFDFAASSWYMDLNLKLKRKLQVAQNNMVRFIKDLGPRSHIGHSEIKQVGLLNTHDRVKQLMLNHMFNIYNASAPLYLQDQFVRSQNLVHVTTRNSEHNFVIPRVYGVAKNNFNFHGSKAWNQLPTSIKCIASKPSFKKSVKEHLCNCSTISEGDVFIYY